jgi:hypothetical protein
VVATLTGSLNLGTPNNSYSQPFFNGLQNYNNSNNLFFTNTPGGGAMNVWGHTGSATGDWGSNSSVLEFISPSSYSATGFTAFTIRVLNGDANIFLDQNYVAGTEMSAT